MLNEKLLAIAASASRIGCRATLLRSGPLPPPSEQNGGDSPRLSSDVQTPSRTDGRLSAHLLLRRIPQSIQDFLETRIAVVGNVDAGKSTLLGVLTKGALDDGRGRARVNLFRHKHEIESGRTSSVGMEIMGFDAAGQPVSSTALPAVPDQGKEDATIATLQSGWADDTFSSTPVSATMRRLSWEDVCAQAAKVISFIVSDCLLCLLAKCTDQMNRIWQVMRII